MAIPVALQLYSVRDDYARDHEGTLRAVKSFGYEGVEFTTIPEAEAAEVKRLCGEIGLSPVSAHVQLQDMLDRPEETFAMYKSIGCQYVAVPHVNETRRPGAPTYFKSIGDLVTVGLEAKKAGLQLLYHNHDFEFRKIDGVNGLDIMYDCIPADILKTELDMCWVNVGGENPAEYLRKYTGRAPVVHLKDFYMAGKLPKHLYEIRGIPEPEGDDEGESVFEFRPVGHGMQDMPSILDACVDAGAKWVVVEQDAPSMGLSPLECARLSREYLRGLGW